jgi:hypothetical protein
MESVTEAQLNAGAATTWRMSGSERPGTRGAGPGLRIALMAGIAGTTTFGFAAQSGAAKPKAPQKVEAPKVRVCHGTWSYSRRTVRATVKAPGPAGVRFTVRDSAGKTATASATIPVGRVSMSRSIGLPKAPILVLATVVEQNANGSLKGVDLTCDLTRLTTP